MASAPPQRIEPRPSQVAVIGVVIVMIVVIAWWWWCRDTTTLLIVRHADRVAGQDALAPAGLVRAQELVHVTEKVSLAGIYHSNTVRARQTVEPTAAALGIVPVELPANDIESLIDHIHAHHGGETVLVVGHSNTVPLIIREAGGPVLADFMGEEFDDLFVLQRCRCVRGAAKLLHMQYGAVSP